MLTVKEKEHWKERINRKVDQAIDNLMVGIDSGYLEKLGRQAHAMALESLGIQELDAQLNELDQREDEIRKERQNAYQKLISQLMGRRKEEQPEHYYCRPSEIDQAIKKRKKLHQDELLAKDELGRKILTLRHEKEELLDTVWLATSGKQIRQLWGMVSELLQQSPTPLRTQALTVEPEPDPE